VTKLSILLLAAALMAGCDALSSTWEWETKTEKIAEVGQCVPVQRLVKCVVKYETGKFGQILGPVMVGQEVKYKRMISIYSDGTRQPRDWERTYE